MKINFDQTIEPLEPLPDRPAVMDADGQPLTLARICGRALINHKGDSPPPGDEQVRRWELAKKVIGGGYQTISVEEAALMKSLIPKSWLIQVTGQALPMLDGE